MATTLAKTVLRDLAPERGARRRRGPGRRRRPTVEMTETIVYRNSCLASGVCRLCHRCSTRMARTGVIGGRRHPDHLARAHRGPRGAARARSPGADPVGRRLRRSAVGPGHGPEPRGAGLGVALEGLAVHRHQAEGRAVAQHPLEVVEQAPVEVAADVDAVVEAAPDPGQGPASRTRSGRRRRRSRSRSRSRRPAAPRSSRWPGGWSPPGPRARTRSPSGWWGRRPRRPGHRRARPACRV